MGAFVPATHAVLRVVDRICARSGAGDALEAGVSAFALEMRETAAILTAATPDSLVLLDEPGRATATADGCALAWAVAEALLARGTRTLLTTHHARLAGLAGIYSIARAWHMDAEPVEGGGVAGGGNGSVGGAVAAGHGVPPLPHHRGALRCTWRLKPGPCPMRHYGLALAPLARKQHGLASGRQPAARSAALTRSAHPLTTLSLFHSSTHPLHFLRWACLTMWWRRPPPWRRRLRKTRRPWWPRCGAGRGPAQSLTNGAAGHTSSMRATPSHLPQTHNHHSHRPRPRPPPSRRTTHCSPSPTAWQPSRAAGGLVQARRPRCASWPAYAWMRARPCGPCGRWRGW